MREKILVNLLLSSSKVVPIKKIIEELSLSEKTVRNLIQDTKNMGESNGFSIRLKRGAGYYLEINNNQLLNKFIELDTSDIKGDIYNIEQRKNMILFLILQEKDFFSADSLAQHLGVSKATILRDLKKVEEELASQNLNLIKKPHYGMMITGEEREYRSFFSKHVLNSDLYLEPTKEFLKFKNQFDKRELREMIVASLREAQLSINDFSLENIINHVLVLSFRAKQGNFISNSSVSQLDNQQSFTKIATDISWWLKQEFEIELPKSEIEYLSIHLQAKTNVEKLTNLEKQGFEEQINDILEELDQEFYTELTYDDELKESLLIHVYPLIQRIYNNLQLTNPLIEDVHTRYSNVFLIALRFSQRIEEKFQLKMTIDEVSYLALHFATHLEKKKSEVIKSFKRIVVICNTGGGSAQLIRLKLESLFTNSIIYTTSSNNFKNVNEEKPDLILTTIPLDDSAAIKDIPLIHIQHVLNEEEILRIKNVLPLIHSKTVVDSKISPIMNLFREELFEIGVAKPYLEVLKEQAETLVKLDYAPMTYVDSVIEREQKFTTIYNNGVAGPHPLALNGYQDCISVTILQDTQIVDNREVKIIFLINLQAGHLFLHREISKFLLQIMENHHFRNSLANVTSYREFINTLKSNLSERGI